MLSKPTLKSLIVLLLVSIQTSIAHAQVEGTVKPEVTGLGSAPLKFQEYEVVLEPDKDEPEWWAGAPSVCRGGDGTFWLAARMRTADAPRGLRGYELRILKSADGVKFEPAHSIKREDVPIAGFERPCLLTDPKTKKFKLYACGPVEEKWSIIKFNDADNPTKFDPRSAKVVIAPLAQSFPRDTVPTGYKDPFILFAEGKYHAYLIGERRGTEKIYHFASEEGEAWSPVGNPRNSIMDLSGWHDFFVRPACVVPWGVGYFFIYEGSDARWHDPVYNVATGLGFTFDLHNVIDLTPDSPLAISTTPGNFATWRYSHWLRVGDELWAYAEVAKPNDSHEVRLFRMPFEEN